MKWSVGITTVPQRAEKLKVTIASIQRAGFGRLQIFEDRRRVGVLGNWVLSAWRMYLENPMADRFLIFQDDVLAVRNLRPFLERGPFPVHGYQNLLTFPVNELGPGWYKAPRNGKSACGLVFDNEGLRHVLSSRHIIDKPRAALNPRQNLDGAIFHALNEIGWKEHVHLPSLLQHNGNDDSTIGHTNYPLASTFPGEDFDALSLLEKT